MTTRPEPPVFPDWEALRRLALEAQGRAYAPYSRFHVGAAALVDDGRLISGCNIENASYGLTLCAECTLIGELVNGGGGRLVAVVTVGNGAPAMPCGRCRQLLWEHGGPDCLIDGTGTPMPMAEVLPNAFDQRDLDEGVTPAS
ncbi:MAG: cytidine deaminase [Ilumatobacteraceae bacterium]